MRWKAVDDMKRKRNEIVKEYYPLFTKRNQMLSDFSVSENDTAKEKITLLNNNIAELSDKYLETLPVCTISRCPYTGQLVEYSVDIFGLGGPWWNHVSPVRDEINAPKTLFAVDGAMKINSITEDAPFTIFPGPDKPFVIPDLLKRHEIKAVISFMEIAGNHVWWIVYYAFPMVYDMPGINDYGAGRYSAENTYGQKLYYSSYYSEIDYDFSIGEWIKQGKLLWIKPNDSNYNLMSIINGCPYLDIEGKGKIQVIKDGKVSFLSEQKINYIDKDPELEKKLFEDIQIVNGGGDNNE